MTPAATPSPVNHDQDAILAASLSSLPFYSTAKDPNASNLADPQLTPRDAPSNKSHGQEALLASLRVPHGHKRKKRISGADRPPAPDAGAGDDPVLSRVKEALSRLEEYERVSTATIATLNAEKVQKAKEDEGLGSTMASGTAAKTTAYDSSRDPRLGTRGTDDSGAKAVAYDQSRDPRLKR
ncbi:hypothetical protein MMC13_005961 [Lambiella insularis]|nr:hypothetical protein [Lambiella insularis]